MKRGLESISQTTAAASQIPEFNKQRPRREESKHDQDASENMHFLPKDDGI